MTESNLESRVLGWLEQQGYPLEMRAAAELRDAGFNALLSYFYDATDEGPLRQIDVLAWKSHDDHEAELRLSLLVECKSSAKNPWVMFADPPANPYDIRTIAHTLIGPSFLPFFLRQVSRRRPELGKTFLFGTIDRLAYGVRAAFSDADLAYQAVMSTLSASAAMLTRTEGEADALDTPVFEIILPVVVIDNVLLEYSLEASGGTELQRRKWGFVAWPTPERRRSTLVSVISSEFLGEWIAAVGDSFDSLKADCSAELKLAAQRWHHQRAQPPASPATGA